MKSIRNKFVDPDLPVKENKKRSMIVGFRSPHSLHALIQCTHLATRMDTIAEDIYTVTHINRDYKGCD